MRYFLMADIDQAMLFDFSLKKGWDQILIVVV